MIIRMREDANVLMAEHVASAFQRQGFDVQVKDGDGRFVIAVLGEGSEHIDPITATRSLAGIQGTEKNNGFFLANWQQFVEAWQFFQLRDSRSAKRPMAV